MLENPALALGIAAVFLLAGAVKGIVGMGLPTVAMGLLGLAMRPAEAAALLVLPSFATNLWQMIAGPGLPAITRRLWSMQICVFAGTLLAIGFLTGTSSAIGSAVLGAVLAVYAVMSLLAVRFSVRPASEPWLSPVIGFLTGLLTGATGVFVVPAVPYLASLGLKKEELIQALGLSFTVSTVALGVALTTQGAFTTGMIGNSTLALVPAFAGMALGQSIRSRLDPVAFRKWFFLSLLLIGIYMAGRAAWQTWVA